MATSVARRVQKRRAALREAGLRPVQIWVPDARRPGFVEECHRQSETVARADRGEAEILDFLDAALTDLDETDEDDA